MSERNGHTNDQRNSLKEQRNLGSFDSSAFQADPRPFVATCHPPDAIRWTVNSAYFSILYDELSRLIIIKTIIFPWSRICDFVQIL